MSYRKLLFSRRGLIGLASILGAMALNGCSAAGALNALVPSDSYRLRADLAYGPQPRQLLDVYLPLNRQAPGPAVVFFYGGSWTSGERASYRFVGEALAARGIAVVIADYRLSPAVKYPVFLQDSALALRWTLDHLSELGADPTQLFVMGHSAGAYNAAMLALDPRWLVGVDMRPAQLAGWIGLAGPYDFLPIVNPDVQVAFDWPATAADSQPMVHASKDSPPALLLAARADTTVNPQRNSVALAGRLQAAGVPVGLTVYEGLGHVSLLAAVAKPLRGLAPVLQRVASFIERPSALSAAPPAAL